MPSSHLILCCPLLLLPPIPPSIRVFSNESALLMRWPKYWSFSFSISPSNEHPGLIFRMDWLDFLAVQGTLKSLLQQAFLMSLVAQMVKCLPAMQETRVQSLGLEDLLEKEIVPHSRTLAWKTPQTEEPGRVQSMGSQRVGHD